VLSLLVLVRPMSCALKPATGRNRRFLVLVSDELFVAACRLLDFCCTRPRFLGLFGRFGHRGGTLVLKLWVYHQTLKGGIWINIFRSHSAFLSWLTSRRTATRLGILAWRQRLDHLLLDVLGLLSLLLLGSLRRHVLVDVLHHVRVFHEVLLISLFITILVLLLLGRLRLLFEQENLLDLFWGQI
jgi:hypothetical protein